MTHHAMLSNADEPSPTPHACCYPGVLQTKNGETFVSETDTEVIPKLLKFAYDSMTAEQQQDSSSSAAQVPFPKVRLAGKTDYCMLTCNKELQSSLLSSLQDRRKRAAVFIYSGSDKA
jgi:hypothetical protein